MESSKKLYIYPSFFNYSFDTSYYCFNGHELPYFK